jgi:tetratricopeptide (TPR) repeat protein
MAEAHATLRRIDTTRLGNKNANWFALAFASHALGEYARELGEVDAALRADPTASVLLDARVRALTALGRTHDVAATLATADRAGPRAAATAYATASSELLAHGHPVEAARAQQAVVERARAFRATNDLRGIAPFTVRWLVPAAALGLLGRASEALALIDSATAELATDPRQRLATGMATDLPLWGVSLRGAVAAHNGDSATALAADRLLVTLRPAPGIARASALVGRAAIAAQLGRRDDAVARLREAIAAGATFGGTNAWSVLRPASGIRPESPWFAPLRGYAPFEDLVRPVR